MTLNPCAVPIRPDVPVRFSVFEGGDRLERMRLGDEPAAPENMGRFVAGQELPYLADWLKPTAVLHSLGSGGQELAERLTAMGREAEAITSRYELAIQDAFKGLTKEEVGIHIRRVIEEGATDVRSEVIVGARKAQAALRSLYDEGIQRGIQVAPEIPPDRYFPHVFDDAAALWIEGSPRRERALAEIMAEHGIDRDAASFKLNRWLERNGERYAKNLEFERLGVKDYVRDAGVAFRVAGFRAARRLAEVRHLGLGDEEAKKAIGRISPGRPQKYAHDVLNLAVGKTRVPLEGITGDAMALSLFKLSTSALVNLTQIAHTMHKGGIARTLTAIGRYLGEGLTRPADLIAGRTAMIERGRMVGAAFQKSYYRIQHNSLEEMVTRSMDAGRQASESRIGKLLKGAAAATAKPMAWTETFLRSISADVGDKVFDSMVQKLRQNPADSHAIARFKEFGVPADRIVRALGDPTALQNLKDEFAKIMADTTQFTLRATDLPRAAQSPMGRLMFQFKNFAYLQTGFLWEESVGAMRRGEWRRAGRMVLALGTAYPAFGLALDAVRDNLLGGSFFETRQKAEALFNDPGFKNYLAFVLSGTAAISTLGIVGDGIYAMTEGNLFRSLKEMTPAAGLTLMDAGRIVNSAARASVEADPSELESAQKAFSRQFGGLGRLIAPPR